MSRPAAALVGLLALVLAAGACTEEGLTGLDGVEPPGQAAETRSVTIPVDQLPLWRDTTYSGFATIQDIPFQVVADQPPLQGRGLYRISEVPDSIGGQAIDSIGEMVVSVTVDTARSDFSADSATLELFSLARDFTADEADWERASRGEPWATPGGDLETELAATRFRLGAEADSLASDTLSLAFRGSPDSLLTAWGEEGRVPPLALRVRGEGSRLVVRRLAIRLSAKNADMDSLEAIEAEADTATFIHDPELPDAGRNLRIGGLPASRFYFVFRPPDTVEGVPLRGARVNRAELVFHPVSESGSPFRPAVVLSTLATELLADPFRFGPRTPIGASVGDRRVRPLDPDSLAAGRPLEVRVSELLQTWASAPPDSIDRFRVGMRPVPDGQDLGFWEFGSVEAADGQKPVLRLLITPPTDFELP